MCRQAALFFLCFSITVAASGCSLISSLREAEEPTVRGEEPQLSVALHRTPLPLSSADTVEFQRAQFDPATAAIGSTAISWAPSLTRYALLYYIPNRFLDLIDVFRFDVGVGVSAGAVLRVSRYAQLGLRGFWPVSWRLGLHGRWYPIFAERLPEFGISPNFRTNRPRHLSTTPAELGAGVDLGLIGGYFGFSFDELFDFVLGIIFIDFKGDDFQPQ